jgi:hypothetical protein
MRPRRFVRTAALLGLAPLALSAAPAGLAGQSVSGVVRDSLLTGGPLPNATLWIDGRSVTARTDLYGRFKFDSVPPGTYQLTFTHPAFDAAGVPAPKWRLQVPAAGLSNILLATPSADTRYGRACPGGPRPAKTGYIVGTVRDAATDSGLAGAVVNVMWTEITVSQTVGVRTARKTSRAETNARGQFVLCRIPNDAEVTVWATRNGLSTGLIGIDLGGRPLAARELSLGTKPLAADASAADSVALAARLEGSVKNIDGEPIPDARVYVRGSRTLGRTTASGIFSLKGLPPGTQTVEVTALGYEPGRMAVDLRPGRTGRAELVLGKAVQRLPSLEVVGKLGAGNDLSTFMDRARRGNGYFITQDDIEKRGSVTFEDVMRGVPGMQVVPVGQGYRIISSRGPADAQGDCPPQYFLDGAPFYVDLNDDSPFPVSPVEIMAIEVYSGPASVPAEFQRSLNGCGVIAIWTKRGGTRPAKR